MAQLISISEAKQKLLELARRGETLGESFVIIKDARPVSALLPFEEYESLLETLDILETDPDIRAKLHAAKKHLAQQDYSVWEPERQTLNKEPIAKPKNQKAQKSTRTARLKKTSA